MYTSARVTMLICLIVCSREGACARGALVDDAVKAYRTYVATIRSGPAEKVLKLVEPVPDASKPVLDAQIEMKVAIEAVKTEIAKQFHPPEPARDDVIMGELPEGWLKDVVGEQVDAQTVKLKLKDPDNPEIESDLGYMIRHGDAWLVSATMALGEEPAAKYVEPRAEILAAMQKVAKAWSTAAKSTLEALKKKQFKTAAEAEAALKRDFARAAGM